MGNVLRKKRHSCKTAIGCLGFIIILISLFIAKTVIAAWEEPSAEAPYGNIYTPINTGPYNQAKQGSLILNPLYNPYDIYLQSNYPLEVGGSQDAYVNNFEVKNDLIVDTDTLYVKGDVHQVGIGTVSPEAGSLLEIAGGNLNIGSLGDPVSGVALSSNNNSDYALFGLSSGIDQISIYGNSDFGAGIYGLNTSAGYGIYAESSSDSASSVV